MERDESRKRRRPLSERRRLFSRLGPSQEPAQRHEVQRNGSMGTPEGSSWSSCAGARNSPGAGEPEVRSDSPVLVVPGGAGAAGAQIPIKVQFHITVAPENEPLIVGSELSAADGLLTGKQCGPAERGSVRRKNSISEYIHDRLSRHNSSSTKRRQQLLAMHRQQALQDRAPATTDRYSRYQQQQPHPEVASDDNLAAAMGGELEQVEGRSVRSSTITGGRVDEGTREFLARTGAAAARQVAHRQDTTTCQREHIFFKRDGQRFGQECTLKLAVDRTYRCLVKVRPLIPVSSVWVQGQQVQFVDCSSSRVGHHNPSGGQWQSEGRLAAGQAAQTQQSRKSALSHARTTGNLAQLQQSQMLRQFAASHCSASSAAQLGSHQLIYMFDWSATRFEANKNKRRTQLRTELNLRNGQTLVLPLQVKFYQPQCRQHLSWGSQLHFIDYTCSMSAASGQLSSVSEVQYY